MRNNFGGDGDGTHTITFNDDGTVGSTYISEGKKYTMYESWRMEDNKVVCTISSTSTDKSFIPYQFDETRYLLIDTDGDYSMVLTKR